MKEENTETGLALERPEKIEIKTQDKFENFNIGLLSKDEREKHKTSMRDLDTYIGEVAYERVLEENSKSFEIISETAANFLDLLYAYAKLGVEEKLPILLDHANDSVLVNAAHNSIHFHLSPLQVKDLQEIVKVPSFEKLFSQLKAAEPNIAKRHEIWRKLFDNKEILDLNHQEERKGIKASFDEVFGGKEEKKEAIKKICNQIEIGGFESAIEKTMNRDPSTRLTETLKKEMGVDDSAEIIKPTFINILLSDPLNKIKKGDSKQVYEVGIKERVYAMLMASFTDFTNFEITENNVIDSEKIQEGKGRNVDMKANRFTSPGRPFSALSIIDHVDRNMEKGKKKEALFRARMEFLGHSNLLLTQIYKLNEEQFKRLQDIYAEDYNGTLKNDTPKKLILNTLIDGGPLALPARNNLRVPKSKEEKDQVINGMDDDVLTYIKEPSQAELRSIEGNPSFNSPYTTLRIARGGDFHNMIDTTDELKRLKPNAPKEIEQYVEQVEKMGLVTTAGVSATTSRNLATAEALGLLNTEQDLLNFKEAVVGYFIPAGHHTVLEVLYGATNVGTDSVRQLEVSPLLHHYINPLDPTFQERVDSTFFEKNGSNFEVDVLRNHARLNNAERFELSKEENEIEREILKDFIKSEIKGQKLEHQDGLFKAIDNLHDSDLKILLNAGFSFLRKEINKIKNQESQEDKKMQVSRFKIGLKRRAFDPSLAIESGIAFEKRVLRDFIKSEIKDQKLAYQNELLKAYDDLIHSDIKILLNEGFSFLTRGINKIKNQKSQEDKNLQAIFFKKGLERRFFDSNSEKNKRTSKQDGLLPTKNPIGFKKSREKKISFSAFLETSIKKITRTANDLSLKKQADNKQPSMQKRSSRVR